MANTLQAILSLKDEFSANLQKARGELRGLAQDVVKNERDLHRAGLALTAIGAAGAAGLGLAAKAGIDFESSFAGVRKTIDATEAEYSGLARSFREMALQIPISVNEINRIGEAAGQLGIKKENLVGFVKVMADLGVATNLSSDEAATSLAQLSNIMKMSQTDFDRLGSTIVDLGNKSATTEADIVSMGLRLAGAGNVIGLSEAQVLGFSAALSSVGIAADAGGTAFSKVFIEIAKNVSQGGDDLDKFAEVAGMSAEEFRKAYEEDAAGAIISFVEGLGRINESGGDLFAVLEDLGITEVRMRDALLRAAGAGDLMRESIDTANTAWEENNALQTEAEKRYATTASQVQLLKNNLNDIAIDIAAELLPVLRDSISLVSSVLDIWRDLPEPVREASVRLVAVGSGMSLVAGAALLMLPSLIKGVQAFRALSTSGGALGGTMKMLPLGFTAVLAAAVLLPPVIDSVKKAFSNADEEAEAFAGGLRQASDMLAHFQGQLNDTAMERAVADMREIWSGVLEGMTLTAGEFKVLLADTRHAAEADVAGYVQGLIESGATSEQVMDMIAGAGVEGFGAVQEVVAALAEEERKRWGAAMSEGAAADLALINSLKAQRGSLDEAAAATAQLEAAEKLLHVQGQNTALFYGDWSVLLRATFEEVAEAQGKSVDQMLAEFPLLEGGADEIMKALEQKFGPDAQEVFEGLYNTVNENFENTKTVIQSLLPTLDEEFSAWTTRIQQMAADQAAEFDNLTFIYGELTAAGVAMPVEILAAVEAQGPAFSAKFAQWFKEDPTAAVENLKLVAPTLMGDTGDLMVKEIAGIAPDMDIAVALAFNAPVERSLEALRLKAEDFSGAGMTAGQAWAQGLSLGIDLDANAAYESAAAVAAGIDTQTRHQMGIESPSKVAMAIGGWWTEGLALGISAGIPIVEAAATALVEAGIRPIRTSIGAMVPDSVAAMKLWSAGFHEEALKILADLAGLGAAWQVLHDTTMQNPIPVSGGGPGEPATPPGTGAPPGGTPPGSGIPPGWDPNDPSTWPVILPAGGSAAELFNYPGNPASLAALAQAFQSKGIGWADSIAELAPMPAADIGAIVKGAFSTLNDFYSALIGFTYNPFGEYSPAEHTKISLAGGIYNKLKQFGLGFAHGGEFDVHRPTVFMAGEAFRPERVSVRPVNGDNASGGSGGDVYVNFHDGAIRITTRDARSPGEQRRIARQIVGHVREELRR